MRMDRSGDELLTRPALTANENGGGRRGCLPDQLVDLDHARVAANERAPGSRGGYGLPCWPSPKLPIREHVAGYCGQLFQADRLYEEGDRAAAHCGCAGLHVVECCHQHDVDRWSPATNHFEE